MTPRELILANPGASDADIEKMNGPTPMLRADRITVALIVGKLGDDADGVFVRLRDAAMEKDGGKAYLLQARLLGEGLDPADPKIQADVKVLIGSGIATTEQVAAIAYVPTWQTGAATTAAEFAAERVLMASDALSDWINQRAATWQNDARAAVANDVTDRGKLAALFSAGV